MVKVKVTALFGYRVDDKFYNHNAELEIPEERYEELKDKKIFVKVEAPKKESKQ